MAIQQAVSPFSAWPMHWWLGLGLDEPESLRGGGLNCFTTHGISRLRIGKSAFLPSHAQACAYRTHRQVNCSPTAVGRRVTCNPAGCTWMAAGWLDWHTPCECVLRDYSGAIESLVLSTFGFYDVLFGFSQGLVLLCVWVELSSFLGKDPGLPSSAY